MVGNSGAPDGDLETKCSCGLYPPPIPNAETVEAMKAAERGEFSRSFASVEELMADLNDG